MYVYKKVHKIRVKNSLEYIMKCLNKFSSDILFTIGAEWFTFEPLSDTIRVEGMLTSR